MKKPKKRKNPGVLIGVLMILAAAALMMAAVIFVYKNRDSKEPFPQETLPKETVKIGDITNSPSAFSEYTKQSEQTGEEFSAEKFSSETEKIEEQGEQVMENESSGTQEEVYDISRMNEASFAAEGSHLVHITGLTEISAEQVRAQIEAYSAPDGAYLDGEPRQAGDFDYAAARRSIETIADPVDLQYGVLIRNASVRSFPTWQKISNGTSADDPDYLQETMLSMGEGVVILHRSQDGIWSFIQAQNYSGWIESSSVAVCSREEMAQLAEPKEFAVVIVPSVTVGAVSLRMGSILPLAGETEDKTARLLLVPGRDEEGKLVRQEVPIATDRFLTDFTDLQPGADKEDSPLFSVGYLPPSEEAIAAQARRLLDFPYGWGDSNEYMDCTSTLRAVYQCFGVILPRNSSWMPNCGLKVTDMREMTAEQRRDAIAALPKGSILLVKGHAMMYMGEEDGRLIMLHNVTRYRAAADGELIRPMKCVITPVEIFNADGVSYLELFQYAISL